MCRSNPGAAPWNLLIFAGVGITAFNNYNRLFSGGDMLLMEAIVILLVASPFLFVQLKLGGLTQRSLYGMLATFFPLLRGVAVMQILQMALVTFYSPASAVHEINAAFVTATVNRAAVLSCSNRWNTHECFDPNERGNATGAYDGHHQRLRTPVDEYVERRFFESNWASLSDLGGFSNNFALALVITWIFVFLLVAFGPRIFGWAVSILGLLGTVLMLAVGLFGFGWNKDFKEALNYFYLPSTGYRNMASMSDWQTAISSVGWNAMLWTGMLPTLGKFTGKGKVTRNITWVFVVLHMVVLRHLPALTITPFQHAAARASQVSFSEMPLYYSSVPSALSIFLLSDTPPAASFFYFTSRYIFQLCATALIALVILDNFVEALDWLFSKRQFKSHIVWGVSSAVFCAIAMLCGLPFTTRGGFDLFGFFDWAVFHLRVVPMYFVTLSMLGVYLWQNVTTAERLAISIWAVLIFNFLIAMNAYLNLVRAPDIYLPSGQQLGEDEKTKWVRVLYVIAVLPIGVMTLVIIADFAKMLLKFFRPNTAHVDDLTTTQGEKSEGHASSEPQPVEMVSSF